ncbi:MAG TPA: DUF885 domain-containing protein [Verrucomicrobiae bacterium]|nr:DUF885 domain-containing protein [Verrucomicrobiae bacterium]
MLNRTIFFALAAWLPSVAVGAPSWVKDSDHYTEMLLAVKMKHHPEMASWQGLSEYDAKVSQPTLADEEAERHEEEKVLAELKAAAKKERTGEVKQDLQILIRRVDLGFREQDFERAHRVPFLNASAAVFEGVQVLLDQQTPAERRPAAVVRLRKYAGMESGCQPLTTILQERVKEQMAKPGVIYPSRSEIETELGRNTHYIEGIKALLEKYQLTGWQDIYPKLTSQLAQYDDWVRAAVLPNARSDFRLPPQEYALALEGYGIDLPPDQLAAEARKAFADLQAQMAPIAVQIAREKHLPSSDYRDVVRALKKHQIEGDAILPLYRERLKQIEKIIQDHQLVSLPDRPARIRLATAAETAQQPAPHMVPPPFLHNTGQKGEFVLPLNMPSGTSGKPAEKYDDFTFDAAAWTLTAHEARPGHELQFDSMLEHGVSRARVLYAFNSANVEGWGLYSENLILPFMPPEGQLISLDYRLLRAARAFIDPELQSGKLQPADAYRILEQDVVQSHAFAQEEVERYTYRAPGQAGSYFFGFTKLIALRKETEGRLGPKFNQKAFHDFILAQGLLPPDLMRKAVLDDFAANLALHSN